MSHILEVDLKGDLLIPAALVGKISPGKLYSLEIQGETLILKPAPISDNGQPTRPQQITPQERIDRLRAWASQPRSGNPQLTDEALRREHLYDA